MNLHLIAIDYLNEHQRIYLELSGVAKDRGGNQAKMRLMIYELKPTVFMGKGLFEALEELATVFRAKYNLRIITDFESQEENLSGKVQTGLYQVFQAALSKIARQAQASTVQVKLEITSGGSGRLMIYHDGQGGAGEEERNGQDTRRHLQERIGEMNGRMQIDTKAGLGTTITITF